MTAYRLIFIIFCMLQMVSSTSTTNGSDSGSLCLISGCICPGSILTYECMVVGTPFGSTVWRGSAFDCLSGEIILLHDHLFMGTQHACSDGSIVAQGLRVDNSSYISQLNVTASNDTTGSNIECVYDDASTTSVIVGSLNISDMITANLPPAPNISRPSDLTSKEVIFKWTSVTSNCPIHYSIKASNCGSCPTTTNNTTVICTDIPTDGSMCIFAVQTIVCRNIIESETAVINVNFSYTGMHNTNILVYIIPGTAVFAIIIIVLTAIILVMTIKVFINARRNQKPNQQSLTSSYRQVSDISSSVDQIADHMTIRIFDNESMGMYNHGDPHDEMQDLDKVPEQPPDLNSLVYRLQGQASSQWYLFGIAFGVPKKFLRDLQEYPETECLIAVLDYWLRNHGGQPTWQEVAQAQRKVDTYTGN